jgi:hypothetical protein
MITEVSADHIHAYAGWFPGLHLELVLASIAAGNTAAQLWKVEQPTESTVALLWDKGNNVILRNRSIGAGSHSGAGRRRHSVRPDRSSIPSHRAPGEYRPRASRDPVDVAI